MRATFFLGIFLYPLLLDAQIVLSEPLSPRQTGYTIDAVLDTQSHKVTGSMRAYWINPSKEPVNDVQMHMYLNAFRSGKSTFYLGSVRSAGITDSGYVEINSISSRGADLSGAMQFISPDDGNPHDKTVLKIDLPKACMPGDSVVLDINFTSKLPGNIIRTGYSGDFYFVAQWFPKFGVYETAGMRYAKAGGWNCHQFHSHSEFYANHSVYNVTVTVPAVYVVGSCGKLLDESRDGSQKKLTFRAEDIVDFAWTAWPGYSTFTADWKHVKITLLLPPERKNQAERQLTAAKNALEYLDERCGLYPWPHLTVVDPPVGGAGAGGMEYTTMITSTSVMGIPGYLRLPELVTVHEFAHSYFMGIMASNESEEPWLDEGVTSYWEGRMMDHFYGGMINTPFIRLSGTGSGRMSYVHSGSRQAADNSLNSWSYPHQTYSMLSYNKAATILHTLQGIIGEEMMDEIFREYYKRWSFKHPSGKDFINTVNEVVAGRTGMYGPDLNWFFNQTLFGTAICDYKVVGMRSTRVADSDSLYRTVIALGREGDLTLPVDILIRFDDGEELLEKWDGISRTKDLTYTRISKVKWVKIDPEYKILLDVDQVNNSMAAEPDQKPVRRIASLMIVLFQVILNLISL